MALSLEALLPYSIAISLLFSTHCYLVDADTCNDCFTHSRAAYYPNSDEKGSDGQFNFYLCI